MAVVVTMAQTSTSQPNLWKPRYAARQHQEKPQQAQQFTRSRSLREPFDAAELTRKLENYRQELKLEKARRELAKKKADNADAPTRTLSAEKETNLAVPETQPSSGMRRSSSVQVSKNLMVNEQPERRRSIMHRKPKNDIKECPTSAEPAAPYVPRVAAKQFANTTTLLKEKKEKRPTNTTTITTSQQQPDLNMKDVKVKDTSKKHVLDWNEPSLNPKPASPPLPTSEYPDAEKTQARMQALHAFRDASKSRPRPSSTALENMRVWDADSSNAYVSHPITKPLPEESAETAPHVHPTHRPVLKADRHDWSQGSQCGDSARASLHLFRKKDSVAEDAEMAGLRAAGKSSKPRQKSHGDASDRLINDAVKQIRDERRRSSILNVFRRH